MYLKSLCGKRPKKNNYKQATTVHRTTGNPEFHEVTRITIDINLFGSNRESKVKVNCKKGNNALSCICCADTLNKVVYLLSPTTQEFVIDLAEAWPALGAFRLYLCVMCMEQIGAGMHHPPMCKPPCHVMVFNVSRFPLFVCAVSRSTAVACLVYPR